MEQDGSLEALGEIESRILLMASTGLRPLLEVECLHIPVMRSELALSHTLSKLPWKPLLRKRGYRMFREIFGSREGFQQIQRYFPTMESDGFRRLL
jgi:hypothetical protein